MSASEDAINQAAEGRASVQSATSRGKDFAQLAARESAHYADFGRKLLTGECTLQTWINIPAAAPMCYATGMRCCAQWSHAGGCVALMSGKCR